MSRRRDPDWYPALGEARADESLRSVVRDVLRIYDMGERIPAPMFELLRERLKRVEGYSPRSAAR